MRRLLVPAAGGSIDRRRRPLSLVQSLVVAAATAALLAPATPGYADGSATLPSGDFTATLQSSSGGAPFGLRCAGGRCSFLGGGPNVESQELREFAQAPVVELAHTEQVRDRCHPTYLNYTERLRIDGSTLSYVFDRPAFRTQGKCGDTTYYINQVEEHDRFKATVTKLVDGAGKEIGAQSPATATPTPSPGAGTSGGGGNNGTPAVDRSAPEPADGTVSRLDSGGAAAPSVLRALPTASDVRLGAGHGLALVAVVLILVLLVAFPTHLLNNAVETGHDKLSTWLRRRRGLTEDEEVSAGARRWAVAAVVVLAASLIASFVDPEFGLNTGSLRVLVSLFVALAVETLLVWFTVLALVRRTSPDTSAGFRAAPATLLVVLVAVVVTRLTGFEPGIIFGLVAGVTFAAASTPREEGRVTLSGLGLGYGLAVLGWLGYSLVGPSTNGAGFGHNLLSDTLSGLAISGIASLPLALVPLGNLPGRSLYAWSKATWGASYALALIGFFLVLMPMPFSWDAVDMPLRTWVLLYVAYAAVAVAAWLAVSRPWRQQRVTD